MKDMNLDAYRFSISWSRILPSKSIIDQWLFWTKMYLFGSMLYFNLCFFPHKLYFYRRKAKWRYKSRRNWLLQQPYQWATSKWSVQKLYYCFFFIMLCILSISHVIDDDNILNIYQNNFRSETICDSFPLGSSPIVRRWVWWLLKPSHCVSDTI